MSAPTTIDNSGSGHNGTLVNGPTWTAGKYGNGISFDGIDDYVSVANPSTLNLAPVTLRSLPGSSGRQPGPNTTSCPRLPATLGVADGKEFFISGSDNTLAFGSFGVGEVHSTGTITNDGLFHYVTVSFVDSSNTIRLYIDGALSGTGTLNLAAGYRYPSSKSVPRPAGYFRGVLDEVRIFNRALFRAKSRVL